MTFLRLRSGGSFMKPSSQGNPPGKGMVLWVLVVDGGRAFIFGTPRGKAELVLKKSFVNSHLTEHDPATDRAGRAFQSYSSVRHGYEPSSSWKIKEKHLFIEEISDFLKKSVTLKQFDRLILVAPPKILGEVRKTFHGEVLYKVTKEIPKDLTPLKEEDLPQTLLPLCFPLTRGES